MGHVSVSAPPNDRDELAQKVGRQIKEERLNHGLSRHELGVKIGVSGQQIDKYESGRDTIPLHRLFTLSRLFNRTPESFWTGVTSHASADADSEVADNSTIQLVRAYKRIGDAKLRRQLLRLMKHLGGEGESGEG
jgi:transcriptional regulator with XRE-family HTH domain